MYSGKIAVPPGGGGKNKKNNQMQTRSNKKKNISSQVTSISYHSYCITTNKQVRLIYFISESIIRNRFRV
jgi:hypothetical protein